MAEYTPGPWMAAGMFVSARGIGTIARCPRPQAGGAFACLHNARLIAAAPDLLEALEACYEVLSSDAAGASMSCTLDARAALDKALEDYGG